MSKLNLSKLVTNFSIIKQEVQVGCISVSDAFRCLHAYESVYEMPARSDKIIASFCVNNMDAKAKSLIKLRGVTTFPHPFSQMRRVLAIAADDIDLAVCKAAGANMAATAEIIPSIIEGRLDLSQFDAIVCDKALFNELKPAARFLQTLFPSEKRGNLVSSDALSNAVRMFKGNITWEISDNLDENQNQLINAPITKYKKKRALEKLQVVQIAPMGFTPEQIFDNIKAHIEAIIENSPTHIDKSKPRITSLHLSTDKGYFFPIDLKDLQPEILKDEY